MKNFITTFTAIAASVIAISCSKNDPAPDPSPAPGTEMTVTLSRDSIILNNMAPVTVAYTMTNCDAKPEVELDPAVKSISVSSDYNTVTRQGVLTFTTSLSGADNFALDVVFRNGDKSCRAKVKIRIDENALVLTVEKDTVILDVFGNAELQYSLKNYQGEPQISISPEVIGLNITNEFQSGEGTITFTTNRIANETHNTNIVITSNGKTIQHSIIIKTIIAQDITNLAFADGTKSKTLEFQDYERIFYVSINDDYYNVTIDIPNEAKDWIQVTRNKEKYIFWLKNNPTGSKRTINAKIKQINGDTSISLTINQIGAGMNGSFTKGLIALFNATNGNSWNKKSNWCNGSTINWHGMIAKSTIINPFTQKPEDILYEGNDNVWKINLEGNNMNGKIPDEFWDIVDSFESINFASLSNPSGENNLNGSQLSDKIWNEKLKNLKLFGNKISGTLNEKILNAKNLETLNLYDNKINGTIPEGISKISNLKELNLGLNNITGTFPSDLPKLKNLEVLNVFRNYDFSGTLTDDFYNLDKIKEIDFCYTKIGGTISGKIKNFKSLKFFEIIQCEFKGIVPEEFGLLENLKIVYIMGNYFQNLPEFYRYRPCLNNGFGSFSRPMNIDVMAYQRKEETGRPADFVEQGWLYYAALPCPGWCKVRYNIQDWENYIPSQTKTPVYPQADDLQYPANEYYFDGTNWRHPNLEYPAREYYFDGTNWVHDASCPWM